MSWNAVAGYDGLAAIVGALANDVTDPATVTGSDAKVREECREFLAEAPESVEAREEMADVLISIMWHQHVTGVDIVEYALQKMVVNRHRTWKYNPDDDCTSHDGV